MDMIETRDLAIGLDIGGTKMKCGVVDAAGNVIGTPKETPTNAHGPREKIVAGILELLNDSLAYAPENRLRGIGIGCTGPLDISTGTIMECNTLPTMHNYPLKHIVELTTCKNVRMNNDANAMMLGEAVWGAGKGRSSILGFTLGTGCGCAFINNGHIWTGITGNAGEIWQSPYRNGIIEDYVSGTGLTRMYKDMTGQNADGKEIAMRARAGEDAAIEVFNRFADGLVFALSWTVNTVDPDVVILGGAVANSADLFLPRVRSMLPRFITRETSGRIELLTASLGDNAGFIGAAALMFE